MNKISKLFITGGILIATGAVAYTAAWSMGSTVTGVGVDREGFHVYTAQSGQDQGLAYQEEYITLDTFSDIEADLGFCDMNIETADSYGISYRVSAAYDLCYEVTNGKLVISQQSKQPASSGMYTNNGSFYFSLFHGSGFGTNLQSGGAAEVPHNTLTIHVPENTALENLTLHCDSGNLSLSKVSADSLDLQANFGRLSLQQVSGKHCEILLRSAPLELADTQLGSLDLKARFSNLELSNTVIEEYCRIDTESGDLSLDHVTSPSLAANGRFSSLDARYSLIGSLDVDFESRAVYLDHVSFTDLSVKSRFGDFTLITDVDLAAYSKDLDTKFGEIRLLGEKISPPYKAQPSSNAQGKIYVRGESCDINISAS